MRWRRSFSSRISRFSKCFDMVTFFLKRTQPAHWHGQMFPACFRPSCRNYAASQLSKHWAVRASGIRRASISKLSLLSTIAADPPAGEWEHGPAADARPWARGISPGVHGPAHGRRAGKQAEWDLRPAGDGGGRLSGPAQKSNGCMRKRGGVLFQLLLSVLIQETKE